MLSFESMSLCSVSLLRPEPTFRRRLQATSSWRLTPSSRTVRSTKLWSLRRRKLLLQPLSLNPRSLLLSQHGMRVCLIDNQTSPRTQ